MKKTVLLVLVMIGFLSQSSFALVTKIRESKSKYECQHLLKPSEDVGYFYGYLSGSRCLYLFRITLGSRLDYTGRSIVTYDISLVNDFNSEGFRTRICPEEAGEWFV